MVKRSTTSRRLRKAPDDGKRRSTKEMADWDEVQRRRGPKRNSAKEVKSLVLFETTLIDLSWSLKATEDEEDVKEVSLSFVFCEASERSEDDLYRNWKTNRAAERVGSSCSMSFVPSGESLGRGRGKESEEGHPKALRMSSGEEEEEREEDGKERRVRWMLRTKRRLRMCWKWNGEGSITTTDREEDWREVLIRECAALLCCWSCSRTFEAASCKS